LRGGTAEVYKPHVKRRTELVTGRLVWVVLTGVALSIVAWWPIVFKSFPRTQEWDAPFFQKMMEVARISVTRYHELPLWNPFECGGVALWDNPQGIGAAPFTWLTLLFGSTRTIVIWYVAHLTLAFVCMWLMARGELALSRHASFVAAAAWAYAGVHCQHLTGGHLVWVSYFYFPLAIVLWRRAERDLRAAVGLGLIGALTMLEGGTYPLPYLATLLGVETLSRLWPPKRLPAIARAAVVVVAVAFSVGAMRFLPVLDQLTHHHRVIEADTDVMHWKTLKDVFLSSDHGRDIDNQQYVWPEYGAYVGPWLLGLAALGLLTLRLSELWMLGLFVFSFALMCGHFAKWSPWTVLNGHVYPFTQMRVPSRFVVLVTIFLSAFAGMAVDRWPHRLRFARARWWWGCTVVLCVAGLLGIHDEIAAGKKLLAESFNGGPQSFKAKPSLRLYYIKEGAPFLDAPHTNQADLGCWEEWVFEDGAALWLGDVPQVKGGSGAVRVVVADRTMNTFTVDVDAKAAGRLLFNSTYDRGWISDVGKVVEVKKMLAVEVPAGKYTVHVEYWPHGMTLGLVLSGASTSILLFAIGRRLLRRRAARRGTVAA
jgi:hypothetical protein